MRYVSDGIIVLLSTYSTKASFLLEDAMQLYIAQLNPKIGAIKENSAEIIRSINEAKKRGCSLVIFPEMAICGYTPEDLLFESGFVEAVEGAAYSLLPATRGITAIIGTVRRSETIPGKPFRNSAIVMSDGQLLGFQDKSLLPTYDVFDEWRYFEPATACDVWDIAGMKIGITICEDLWPCADQFYRTRYSSSPLEAFQGKNLDLLVNISASPYCYGKIETRREMVVQAASYLGCPVALANQVGAQDGLIFDGSSMVVSSAGRLLAEAASFATDGFVYDFSQKSEVQKRMFAKGQELFLALRLGVRDYFAKQGFSKACLGLSGGVDSAVVACIAVEALGKENVLGVLLPSRFTSKASRDDALELADNMGIATEEISIEKPLKAFLDVLEPVLGKEELGVTQENLQSRIRGTLLMAISNEKGCLLLNTGNKSELAVGFTTLYGDGCGAISVIGDLLKWQVYELGCWINAQEELIPESILEKEPTAELRDNQKDSDTIPKYPILDVIIQEYVVDEKSPGEIASQHGFELSFVEEVISKIHANEYKRRQVPFALRVSDKAFSCGRKVPIVH